MDGNLNAGAVYPEKVLAKKLKKGNTLLEYYCENYAHSSREAWQQKILNGQVKVDGDFVTDCGLLLRAGQLLEYCRPPWIEPIIPSTEIKIVYSDEDVLIINKVSGVPVLPGGYFHSNTILHLLQQRFPDQQQPFVPVHRLGRGTSGLLVIAKNTHTAQVLSKDFREHNMVKMYMAILSGIVEKDEFDINQPIGQVSTSSIKFSDYHWVALDSGKPSHSHFKVLKRDTEKGVTVCAVTITTGRAHQIRIHSAYAGHPLYKDPLYVVGGGVCSMEIESEDAYDPEVKPKNPIPSDCGYYLHNWKMEFEHPRTKEKVVVAVDPPQQFCEQLGESGWM